MIVPTLSFVALAAVAAAHADHRQKTMAGPHQGLWYNTLPGDGGTQVREMIKDGTKAQFEVL